jgi:hypothetical protein
MLRCREVVAYGDALLEGEVSGLRRLGLRFHLLLCHRCRRYLRQLRLLRQTLGRLARPISRERVDALMRVIKDRARR